ncbi:hypothetical protein P4H94_26840 [Paenibacillus macerans]|uniref:hypothetical protein n=1 Tax=Paenibacillus macerans TaxID=44252 RepID=UPI001F0F9130|nr:hypothetical protein [Paenibacillus macerans]MBS5914371.1 hypothetical protein [Paenibacillus macerans]MDU5946430.1 hypothetical protein [Paenibacillus macerans]MEC0140464.1 hypothetical protein [Paenibacillus macerans]UMV45322.1 hypothetical protein LMZ02_17485 [Paenibacillus macerans]
MHYFLLEQDERSKPLLVIGGQRDSGSGNGGQEYNSLYVREEAEVEFIDYVEGPRRLVSNRMKQLLELYEAGLGWTSVILTAKEAKRQELYWFLEPKERDVLSKKSKRDQFGRVTTLVLDGNRLRGERLFCAEGHVIVHLDVAESLLRRAYTGLRLIPLEVNGGSDI